MCISNRSARKIKNILRYCKSRKAEKRFVCDVCKVTHDAGWVYFSENGEFHVCLSCRNKYLPGKMQRRMLYTSSFESSKKRH